MHGLNLIDPDVGRADARVATAPLDDLLPKLRRIIATVGPMKRPSPSHVLSREPRTHQFKCHRLKTTAFGLRRMQDIKNVHYVSKDPIANLKVKVTLTRISALRRKPKVGGTLHVSL